MSNGDERADYLMEAFLDEQNTLIRPLVARKLCLVKVLDDRAQVVEKVLEEKRKNLLNRRGDDLIAQIENLEDELEQLSIEKVAILNQLMDLVKRPYETIVEVESTLGSGTSESASLGGAAQTAATASTVAVVDTASNEQTAELWCFCRQPDDGRPMVACDNSKCELVWWHINCVEKYIGQNRIGSMPPDDSRKWHCPVCVSLQLTKRKK
jgi:hypothetical protein